MLRRKATGRHQNSLSPFSAKLICGDCGGYYGSKVWHSNSKYRRTIWQCNGKFKGVEKCRTPHLYEDDIKAMFLKAVSELMIDREALIDDGRVLHVMMRRTGLKEMFIVRYADDFRIFCRNREDAERTMASVTQWITERLHLEVSPEKTRIVNVRKRYSEFLGFKIRVFRKGEKYVVRSHICDKKLQLEERKLVEQAKHIANPTEGKSQPAEIGLFDEMVLGIQNYYKIATCISLDCRKLHRRVMTVLTNRLNTESGCQLVREGGVMTESEKARFGASAMVRYVSGINRPIYPIAFIKYKMAIGISPAVCCFSTAGRKKIHDMLEVDMTLFSGLREHLPDAHSMEYADCRLSLLAVQKGVCSISGEKFVTATEIACHLKTPKEYGGLERYSNLVLIHKKYVPLLQIGDAKSLRDICRLLKVTKKQLTKINTLRKAAKLAAI